MVVKKQADEETEKKPAHRGVEKPERMGQYFLHAVLLHHDDEQGAEHGTEADGQHELQQRPALLPGRNQVDEIGDRKAEALGADEGMPERARFVDGAQSRNAGIHGGDQQDRLPAGAKAGSEPGQDVFGLHEWSLKDPASRRKAVNDETGSSGTKRSPDR